MGDKSGIEWTDATWNFLNGCRKKSPGCKNCYAETLHDMRHKAFLEGKLNITQYAKPFKEIQFMPQRFEMPLRWKKPRFIFVNSMSDTFHEDVPFEFIDKAMAVIALCPRHTFQVLTKRPERMAEYFAQERDWALHLGNVAYEMFGDEDADCFVTNSINGLLGESDGVKRNVGWPMKNLWLGTSVENQQEADRRIPHLLDTPAAIRFLSCEPLLGPVELSNLSGWETRAAVKWLGKPTLTPPGGNGIHWIIAGGESGKEARPLHPDWVRGLRNQCKAAGAKFFFKQFGEYSPVDERLKPGQTWPKTSTIVPFDGIPRTMGICARDIPMHRVGKKRAGRVLDGCEHNEMPEVAEVAS